MKKHLQETQFGFNKPLAQEFLILRCRAEEKQDDDAVKTLDVIISGIVELTRALADGTASLNHPLSADADCIFSDLVASCNDEALLQKAGMHYLMDWHLPEIAVIHFQRAQEQGSLDKKLPMLIDIATVAAHRKNGKSKSYSAGRMSVCADKRN